MRGRSIIRSLAMLVLVGTPADAAFAADFEPEPVLRAHGIHMLQVRVREVVALEDLKAPTRTSGLSGRMSRRAAKEFVARGWTVNESFSIAAER
jgi:hypothetical protein